MPNGKVGDNPLSDLAIHDMHPFPPDIEALLLEVNRLGRGPDRWPLGENWPFSPREFDWASGRDLDDARQLLTNLIEIIKAGRGDQILIDPHTGRPLAHSSG